MQYAVHLLAFTDGDIRLVEIPDTTPPNNVLNAVWHWGQNDFQPMQMPSVSVGDIISIGEKFHLVTIFEFREISKAEFNIYKNLSQRERMLWTRKEIGTQ